MATNQHYSNLGPLRIVDKRNIEDANNPISSTLHNATRSQAALDAQLTTLNAAYFTAAKLQSMNLNDKLYELRLGYDAAGI